MGPEGKRLRFMSLLCTASALKQPLIAGCESLLRSVVMKSTSVSLLTLTYWLIVSCFKGTVGTYQEPRAVLGAEKKTRKCIRPGPAFVGRFQRSAVYPECVMTLSRVGGGSEKHLGKMAFNLRPSRK